MSVDIRAASSQSEDLGNTEILQRSAPKTIRLMMFGTASNGEWAAERHLRHQGIPLREMECKINRKGFQYVVGQPLRVTYASRGITDVVFRIMNIKESQSDYETVTLQLLEDADYISQAVAVLEDSERGGSSVDWTLEPLTDMRIMEVPYVQVGGSVYVLPLFGRKKGTEIGYQIYYSLDGTTYLTMGSGTSFAQYGVTVNEMAESLSTTDKTFKLTVDFALPTDAAGLGDVERAVAISGTNNLSVICSGATDEIFTFDTIEPEGTVAGRYFISGFIRGRYDTQKRTWPVGSEVYIIGTPKTGITDDNFLHGATRYFKFVPYNSKQTEELSNASPVSHTFVSRALLPYIPGNLRINETSEESPGGATYRFGGTDSRIAAQISWSPRIRGEGAGIGSADEVTDAYPTWELLSYFDIVFYTAGGTVAASVTPVTGVSIGFSEGYLHAAYGGTPDNMVIKLRNSRLTSGTIYSSEYTVLNAARK